MTIRPATLEDNDRLLAMEENTPQGSSVRLLTKRRHFRVRADRFHNPILLVDEEERTGTLRGVMGVGPVKVTVNGKSSTGGLLFDWRSNNQVTGSLARHMYRIWQAVQKEAAARKMEFLFGHVKRDNNRSLDILTRSGAKMIDTVVFLTIPVHRAFSSRKALQDVRVETAIDAQRELAQVRSRLTGHNFLPEPDFTGLSQRLADHFVPAVIRLGESSLKIWDTSQDYQHQVLSIPKLYQMAGPVFRKISGVLPVPHIPDSGETIREWYLYDLIIQRPEDLSPLLEMARQLARNHQIDYLIIGVNPQDALYPLLAARSWLKLPYDVLFLPLSPGMSEMPNPPTYFDVRYL